MQFGETRHQDQRDEYRQVVEGKDSQRAAGVEAAEIPRAVPGVDQDAGDQEPRQYEEQVNAAPPDQRHAGDQFVDA